MRRWPDSDRVRQWVIHWVRLRKSLSHFSCSFWGLYSLWGTCNEEHSSTQTETLHMFFTESHMSCWWDSSGTLSLLCGRNTIQQIGLKTTQMYCLTLEAGCWQENRLPKIYRVEFFLDSSRVKRSSVSLAIGASLSLCLHCCIPVCLCSCVSSSYKNTSNIR
jgi:hypothetical protein